MKLLALLLPTIAAQLIWSDEFDNCPGGNPNPNNWGFEHGFVRNKELQWYQPDNAKCVSGRLVITAEHLARPDPTRGNANYTSSSLLSHGKQEFLYGRFELRARIDIRMGSWPAWWWLGTGNDWPHCGEIDMMEFYQGKTLLNVMDSKQQWTSKTIAVDTAWGSQFHNWTMNWTPTAISLVLDGVEQVNYQVSRADVGTYNPFHLKGYMLINQAIGGNAGGDPSRTTFPVVYEVEYVRVYKNAFTEML